MEGNYDRRRRIRRLKKIIAGSILAAMIIPLTVSIALGIYVSRLKGRISELEEELASLRNISSEETGIYTTASVETFSRSQADEPQLMEKEDAANWDKQVYLTFDDGPSANTGRILDILKEYDVKATFFVLGKTDANSIKSYQRIVEEGHTLAMHSYSHKYGEIYRSEDSFVQDLEKLQEHLYQVTGIWSRFYRFPGGSSNAVSKVDMQQLISYLNKNDITYFDWNIASGDAVSVQLPVETIVNNCVSGVDNVSECMILMHDASEKNSTVDALPRIIEQIKGRGDTVFLPITDETVPVQHVTADNISIE